MRFCLSNFPLKCASSDIQDFVAGLRDKRSEGLKHKKRRILVRRILVKAHFGNCVFSLFLEYVYLCKIANYEKSTVGFLINTI